MEVEVKSVRQGNNRHANIARWIGSARFKKDKPDRLELLCWCGDDAPDVHAAWDFEDVDERLALQISELIDGYADNAGQHCRAELRFMAGEVVRLSSKYRGICKDANRLGQTVAYDGSMSSQLQQNQKHLEALAETIVNQSSIIAKDRTLVLEWSQTMIERSTADAAARIERAETERDAALERVAKAEELLERAVEAAEEHAKAAEQAAGKDDDRVGAFLQLVQNGPGGVKTG
jgi:hypothetical protein